MNNPVRAALQRHYEAPLLKKMGGPVSGGRVLEIGCGRGVGIELILDLFQAGRVDAFDFDPRMVARARARLQNRGPKVRLWVGDATAIPVAAATYDAVFDFGIIHHIPEWRLALHEVKRVLKPGGRFYAEEMLARFINHPVARALLDHPRIDRFDAATFGSGLAEAGLQLQQTKQLLGSVAWFTAGAAEVLGSEATLRAAAPASARSASACPP